MNEPLDKSPKEPFDRGAGRPERISDEELRTRRDQLLALIESTWYDIGYGLETIQHVRDVSSALAPWQQHQSESHLIPLLLRSIDPGEDRGTAMHKIAKLQTGRAKQKTLIRRAELESKELKNSVAQVDHAVLALDASVEFESLLNLRQARVQELNASETVSLRLRHELTVLEKTLDSAYAYFAQTEVADFCSSKRYVVKPFAIANALAGLPYISWRQSMKRCSGQRVLDLGGGKYTIVEILCKIVASCSDLSRLSEHCREWLSEQPKAASPAIAELKHEWHHLRKSILAIAPIENHRALAFSIAHEYERNRLNPTQVDIVMELAARLPK